MKLVLRKALWILLGVAVYFVSLILGAIVYMNVNVATWFWGSFFPMAVIVCASMSGFYIALKGITLKDPPEYDLDLLVHAVINQLQTDFETTDLESMDEMLKCLIEDKERNHEVLYNYLSDTGQQNLKEGLTEKRW